MPKKNIPLLERLRTRFLRMRHKEHFDQEVIAARTECGAAMCSIGHTLDLCGYKMRVNPNPEIPGFLDFDFIKPSGRLLRNDLHYEAQKLLGLSFGESCRLFTDYSIKTPKQAAARITNLIEEG